MGLTQIEAESQLSKSGLSFRTVGDGDVVTDQAPVGGVAIPSTAQVVLYMGGSRPTEPIDVPDVTGLSVSAAKAKLERAGFYMKTYGADDSGGNIMATKQSVSGQAVMGTVITVEFTDMDQRAE